MAVPTNAIDRPSARAVYRTQDVASPAATAFARLCEVEKWPVWLSFLRTARLTEPDVPFAAGSEVAIRSSALGHDEELFEVDGYIEGYLLSLVGAYSCRRRLDLRIERKTDRSKIVVRLDYPTYGGVLSEIVDRLTTRRKLDVALGDSLVHFKGLAEYDREGSAADDF